ncbi:hypothetical protein HDU92_001929 [Lobulomyces angularis]|nr:hypothetical protein HDU92_001929 [Lobulomyces angularis]
MFDKHSIYQNGKGKPYTILSSDIHTFPNSNKTTMNSTFLQLDLQANGPKQTLLDMEGIYLNSQKPAGLRSGANVPSLRYINNITFTDCSQNHNLPQKMNDFSNEYENLKKEYFFNKKRNQEIAKLSIQDRVYIDEKRFRNFNSTTKDSYQPKTVTEPIKPHIPQVKSNIPDGDKGKLNTFSSVNQVTYKKHLPKDYSYEHETFHQCKSNVLPSPQNLDKGNNSDIYSTTNKCNYSQHPLPPPGKRISLTRGKSCLAFGEQVNVDAINERIPPASVNQMDYQKPNKNDFLERKLQVKKRLNEIKQGSETALYWSLKQEKKCSEKSLKISTQQSSYKPPRKDDEYSLETFGDASANNLSNSDLNLKKKVNGDNKNFMSCIPTGDKNFYDFKNFKTIGNKSYKNTNLKFKPNFPKLGEKVTLSVIEFGTDQETQPKFKTTAMESYVDHKLLNPQTRHQFIVQPHKTCLKEVLGWEKNTLLGIRTTKGEHYSIPAEKVGSVKLIQQTKIIPPRDSLLFRSGKINKTKDPYETTMMDFFKLREGITDICQIKIDKRIINRGSSNVSFGDKKIKCFERSSNIACV